MKQLRIGNAVLCEYVAKGAGNKYTLVNVLGGDLLVPRLPAVLQLGVYIELLTYDTPPEEVMLDLALDRRKITKLKLKLLNPRPNKPATLVIASLELPVQAPCLFTITLSVEGAKRTKAIEKRIILSQASSSDA